MVYSSAVVDPVATLHEQKIDLPGFNFSFGAFDDMVSVLTARGAPARAAADIALTKALRRLDAERATIYSILQSAERAVSDHAALPHLPG